MLSTSEFDPDDMLGAVLRLPADLATTWARVADLVLARAVPDLDGVVVAGMGGSAIGGDLAARQFADGVRIPMEVARNYRLPAWVGPRSLVVASSFSGNTEETLAAFDDAGRRGAYRVVVTSGGELAERARRADVQVVALPGGGQPRAALGASLASLLGVLRAAGVIPDPGPTLKTGARLMTELVADCARGGADHPVACVAERLQDRLPFIYAPEDLAPVARRWKTQLNENAKTTAAWDCLPELDHNALVGYTDPGGLAKYVHTVVLTAAALPERMHRRVEATVDVLRDYGMPHDVVRAPDGLRAAQTMWLVQFGDLVSVALAHRYRVDPTRVIAIERFKAALGRGGRGHRAGPLDPVSPRAPAAGAAKRGSADGQSTGNRP